LHPSSLVGEGDGDGDGDVVGDFADSVVERSDDRLDVVVDSDLGDLDASVFGAGGGTVVGSGVTLTSMLGAAALAPGTRGRAETGDDPAWSELVNVTTVARATVDITAAAANLYSLMGGTERLSLGGGWSRRRHPP